MRRVIIHVDMDAFFAAVEQHDHPEYRGKAVVIGSDPQEGSGRGVVSTCSYEARKFGIRSAMPISEAYRRCPHAIFIRGKMQRYKDVSSVIMRIFSRYSPYVEALSLDEAFLDCSGCEKIFGTPEQIASSIKSDIYNETGLTASAGISSIKSIAKIASDMNKPDGLTICPPGHEIDFLKDLDVKRLWGVGKKGYQQLSALGIEKIGDISSRSLEEMVLLCGNSGKEWWRLSRGLDYREVESSQLRKSISEEVTFDVDKSSINEITHTLKYICDNLSFSMSREKCKGRTISIKIRYENFETITRRKSYDDYTRNYNQIFTAANELLVSAIAKDRKIRLIGVSISNLNFNSYEVQPLLFENTLAIKDTPLDTIINDLKIKYGKKIKRATLLNNWSDYE